MRVISQNAKLRNNLRRATTQNLSSAELGFIMEHALKVFYNKGVIRAMPQRIGVAFEKLVQAYQDLENV
jgi:hypothetical protein